MAKKNNSSGSLLTIIVLLIGIVVAVGGIYQAVNYLAPGTSENASSEAPNPGGPSILPDLDINLYVDGQISDGYIHYEELFIGKLFEIRNKADNHFYNEPVRFQTNRTDSFQITDLNGDDKFVRTEIKMLVKEFVPVKIYLSSNDFIFYVLVNIASEPATGISIGDITFYK